MTEVKIQGETVSQRPEKKQLDGTEAFLLQDSEGTKHAKASTLKEFVQPDMSGYAKKTDIPNTEGLLSKTDADQTYQPKGNYATKTDLASKVSGTGVASIQVVAELPEAQEDGVLYIVTGEGGA